MSKEQFEMLIAGKTCIRNILQTSKNERVFRKGVKKFDKIIPAICKGKVIPQLLLKSDINDCKICFAWRDNIAEMLYGDIRVLELRKAAAEVMEKHNAETERLQSRMTTIS